MDLFLRSAVPVTTQFYRVYVERNERLQRAGLPGRPGVRGSHGGPLVEQDVAFVGLHAHESNGLQALRMAGFLTVDKKHYLSYTIFSFF